MTKLNAEEMLRLSNAKKVIYLDKRKSNIQAWIDSGIRLQLDKYCIEEGEKKQDVVEQAITLYLFLVINGKLDEVVKKYLPKSSVKKE
jgi:hypothetical protein